MTLKITLTLIFTISVILALLLAKSTFDVYKNKGRVDTVNTDLSNLEQQNQQLKAEIEYRKTDQFIVNEAREKLNYSFEGEEIIIVPKGQLSTNPSIQNPPPDLSQNTQQNQISPNDEKVYKMWVKTFL